MPPAIQQPISNQMDDLFGPPPLIMGEDKNRYWRLHAAVENEVKPENLFDRIFVRELTDRLWQQQRHKQSLALVVENAYVEALASLLRPFFPSRSDIFDPAEDDAMSMAVEYYSGETTPKRLEELNGILAIHRVSQEHILAKAMELRGGQVSMLIRMETNSDTALRMLRKEHTHRVAAKAGKPSGFD